MNVQDGGGRKPAALGEDEMRGYLHRGFSIPGALQLGEGGAQAVHQCKEDAGQDVEVLVVEA